MIYQPKYEKLTANEKKMREREEKAVMKAYPHLFPSKVEAVSTEMKKEEKNINQGPIMPGWTLVVKKKSAGAINKGAVHVVRSVANTSSCACREYSLRHVLSVMDLRVADVVLFMHLCEMRARLIATKNAWRVKF